MSTSWKPLRWPGRVRRRLLVHRRPLAAAFAALAVLATLRAVDEPPERTVEVWTAAHDLPSGTVLRRDDLDRVRFRPGSIPSHLVRDPAAVLGRTIAAPVGRGEPLTDLRLVARSLLSAYPGLVATPVRLADPAVVDLLHVGDMVQLVSADPQGRDPAQPVSTGVRVIAIPATGQDQADAGLPGRLVLLAVPAADAAEVSAAGVTGYLTATLSG